MNRQPKPADLFDWEELAETPNTRGAFSFLRLQGSVIEIQQHRTLDLKPDSSSEDVPSDKTSTVDITTTVDDRLVKPATGARPYRVHRCHRAQDGHSHGENLLYAALWQAGISETSETKRVTMGWDRMARAAGMSDKAAQRNMKQLREKLAAEEIAAENSASRTGKTYRVFSYKAILERRRAAGMTFVTKDKGVRFVATPEDSSEKIEFIGNQSTTNKTSTVDIATTVDKTSSDTVDITSSDTVDKTSTPLGSILGIKNRKTTTVEANLDPLVSTLAKYVVADEGAAQKILSSCREACETATVEEIAAVISLKAPAILRDRSINNPLGLLITSVPQCFQGAGIDRLRAEWAAEKKRQLECQQERERQEAEMAQWLERRYQKCRDILNRETSTDKEKSRARDELSGLEGLLVREGQAICTANDRGTEPTV